MEFAKMCGFTQAQVSAWENGKAFPTLESSLGICEAYGTSIAELLGETEPKVAPPRPATKCEMALWVIEAIGINGFQLDHVRRILTEKYPATYAPK